MKGKRTKKEGVNNEKRRRKGRVCSQKAKENKQEGGDVLRTRRESKNKRRSYKEGKKEQRKKKVRNL